MKIHLQNFYQLFMEPPSSEEELFENITCCMYAIDPDWQLRCKPAPKEDIECLEKVLTERFGRGIPASYRAYLELMGEEDDKLVSWRVDHPEFWNYFKGDNMAQGAVRHMEEIDKRRVLVERNTQEPFPIPPFWNYYYTMFTGEGWGFSPKTEDPDQIIQADGVRKFYFTHDTFSQFLFYCVYEKMMGQIWTNAEETTQPIYKLPSDEGSTYLYWMSLACPEEWIFPDTALLVNFLKEIEESCCVEECWFSSQKEFMLLHPEDASSKGLYEFARYVGCQAFDNLTISMCFERGYEEGNIKVWIVGQDKDCIQWLVNEISKRVTEVKNMSIEYLN